MLQQCGAEWRAVQLSVVAVLQRVCHSIKNMVVKRQRHDEREMI